MSARDTRGLSRERGQVINLAIHRVHGWTWLMLRSPRIEFPGAMYHVLARGNRQEPVSGLPSTI